MTVSENIKLAVMGLELSNVGKKLFMIEGKTDIDNSMLLSTAKEITVICNLLADLLNTDSEEERA